MRVENQEKSLIFTEIESATVKFRAKRSTKERTGLIWPFLRENSNISLLRISIIPNVYDFSAKIQIKTIRKFHKLIISAMKNLNISYLKVSKS